MSSPLIDNSHDLTRRSALWLVAAALIVPRLSLLPRLQPFLFTKMLRRLGADFAVTVEETVDLQVVRRRLGVPADLAAFHTAEIAGYVIEGHVPASGCDGTLSLEPSVRNLHGHL